MRFFQSTAINCKVRKTDGSVVDDVHLEDVILVPESIRSLETKEPLEFPEDEDHMTLGYDLNCRRSPGLMLEAKSDEKAEHRQVKPGKMERIVTGG